MVGFQIGGGQVLEKEPGEQALESYFSSRQGHEGEPREGSVASGQHSELACKPRAPPPEATLLLTHR